MHHAHAVLLPEAANDQSFAMTSSFTGMLLAAAAALHVLPLDDARIGRLARIGNHVLDSGAALLRNLVAAGFERVVYLGSQELKGLAGHADTLVLGDAGALTDLELCFPYAVFAQTLAMLRSLSLGLTPDNPNAAGTVNRVVQGVSIYPYGGTP